MKVSGYEVFVVANPTPQVGGPLWVFVRIDTDAGYSGYGELTASPMYSPPAVLKAVISAFIEDFVVGQRVEDLELLYHRVFNSHYSHAGDLTKTAIFSAVEIACWDALAKSRGVPIHDLLGGTVRDQVRMYSYLNPGPEFDDEDAFWADPAAVGARARQLVDECGFTGFKLDPIPLLTGADTLAGQYVPLQIPLARLDHLADLFGAIRSAVGPDADIMLGSHGQMTTSAAVRVAKRLEEFDPLWFEEPVQPDLASEMAVVARATSIPICAGERLTSKWEFARLAEAGAASIFNLDLTQVGGFLEAKKIAALAECHYIQISPHVFGGPIVAAASLQYALSLPNFVILEGNGTYEGVYRDLLTEPLRWENGALIPNGLPGLGTGLNEELARELAAGPDHEFQYRRTAFAY